MNHHFDLYHQTQNYFGHLTPADVNCAEKNPKYTQIKTQKTVFFLFAIKGTANNLCIYKLHAY